MASDPIKVRIQLEGGQEVEATLSDLGEKGADAFKKLQDATQRVDFNKVKQGAEQVREGVDKLGNEAQQSGAQMAGAMDGAGAAARDAGVEAQNAAQNINVSFKSAGVTVDGFSNKLLDVAFKFNTIVDAATKAAGIIQSLAGIITGFVDSGAKLGAGIVEGAEKLGVTAEEFQALKEVFGDDGIKAIKGIDKAAGELFLNLQRGGEVSRTVGQGLVDQLFAVRREVEAGTAAIAKKAEVDGDAEDAEDGVAGAIERTNQALDRQTVRVRNFFSKTAKGNELETSMSEAAQALQKLGVEIDKTDRFTEVLRKLVAAFEKIEDPLEKNRLGVALLGDKWDELRPKMLGGVKAYDDAIKEAAEKTKLLTNEEAAALAAFDEARKGLDKGLDLLKAKIGAVFAPDKTEGKKFFTDIIESNQELIVGLAKTAKAKLDLFFNAKDASGQTAFGRALEVLKQLGTDIASFWETTLLPALGKIKDGFDAVAAAINRTFGTNISGTFLIIATAATALGSAILGLSGHFGTVLTAAASLLAALLPFAPLFAALAVVAVLFWDALKTAGVSAFNALGPAMQSFKDALSKLVSGDFAGAWEDFKRGGLEAFAAIKPVALQLWEDVKVRASELWAGVLPLALSLWESIKAAGLALWQEIKTFAAGVWADLKADPNVGGFFTALENGFKSALRIGTLFKDLLDRLAIAFEPLAEGINRIFGTQLTGGDVALLAIMGRLTGSFGAFDLLLVALGTGLTNFILDVKNAIQEVVTLGEKAAEALKNTAAGLNPFSSQGAKGSGFLEFLNPLKEVPKEVKDLWDTIKGIFSVGAAQAAEGAEASVKKFDPFHDLVVEARAKFGQVKADAADVGKLLPQLIAGDTSGGTFDKLVVQSQVAFKEIGDAATQLGQTIRTALGGDTNVDPLSGTRSGVEAALKSFTQLQAGIDAITFESLTDRAREALDKVRSDANAAAQAVRDALAASSSGAAPSVDGSAFTAPLVTALNALRDLVGDTARFIRDTLSNIALGDSTAIFSPIKAGLEEVQRLAAETATSLQKSLAITPESSVSTEAVRASFSELTKIAAEGFAAVAARGEEFLVSWAPFWDSAVVAPVRRAWAAIGEVSSDGFKLAQNAGGEFLAAWSGLWADVVRTAAGAWPQIIADAQRALSTITSTITALLPAVEKAFSTFTPGLPFEGLITATQKVFEELKAAAEKAGGEILKGLLGGQGEATGGAAPFAKLEQDAGAAGAEAAGLFWERFRTSTNVEDRRGVDPSRVFVQFEGEAIKSAEAIAATFDRLFAAIAQGAGARFAELATLAQGEATRVLAAILTTLETNQPFAVLVTQARVAFDEIRALAQSVGTAIAGVIAGGGQAGAQTGVQTGAPPGGGEGTAPAPVQGAALFQPVKDALAEVVRLANEAAQTIRAAFEQPFFGQLASSAGTVDFSPLVTSATNASQQVQQAFGQAFAQIGQTVAGSTAPVDQAFTALVQRITGLFQTDLVGAVNTAMGGISSAVQTAISNINTQLDALLERIRQVAQAANDASTSSSTQGSPAADGLAGGGMPGRLARGPGTGTSDSILARISNGEFINRVAAVRHYGPRFFYAINKMRIPRERLFSAIRGFSAGGLATTVNHAFEALPRFANGGLADALTLNMGGLGLGAPEAAPAAGGTPFNLVLPSGKSIGGFRASQDAVAALHRAARNENVASTGRKPVWFS